VSGLLPDGWSRLHPLSPVAKSGRALVAVAILVGPRQLTGTPDRAQLVVDLVVFLVLLLGGIVSWRVTRWRVHGADLQLEEGLLRRQSLQVPLTQLQAVDVVRPFVARLLGLSELRLVLAGEGPGRGRLAFLTEERAVEVRAQLLALAHGLAGDTPEAPERPLLTVPPGRLVASVLLGAPFVVLASMLVLLVVLALAAPSAVGPLAASLAPLLFGSGAAVARRLNLELGFTVAESPDGLRLRSGLLQTRASTIPHGRVQAVRLVEPVLWRPLGWCRLEVDVAQQRQHELGEEDSQQLDRALLPVGSRAEAEALLARVLPGAGTHPPAASGAPRRARVKAPLSWHQLRFWHDDAYATARTGRLTARTVVVPLVKLQSLRRTQGPLQRRLRLATLHLDTAGKGWHAAARDRDAGEAEALIGLLPGQAGAARARLRRVSASGPASAARTADASPPGDRPRLGA
jgi:putative membrane protein